MVWWFGGWTRVQSSVSELLQSEALCAKSSRVSKSFLSVKVVSLHSGGPGKPLGIGGYTWLLGRVRGRPQAQAQRPFECRDGYMDGADNIPPGEGYISCYNLYTVSHAGRQDQDP